VSGVVGLVKGPGAALDRCLPARLLLSPFDFLPTCDLVCAASVTGGRLRERLAAGLCDGNRRQDAFPWGAEVRLQPAVQSGERLRLGICLGGTKGAARAEYGLDMFTCLAISLFLCFLTTLRLF